MLLAVTSLFISALAPARHAVYMASSSTTLNSTSMKTSLNISWMASFIGSDSIWPVPPDATTNLVLSGWALLKPASLISLRASSGAYFSSKLGLPNHGLVLSTWP